MDVFGGRWNLKEGQEMGLWNCHYHQNQRFVWVRQNWLWETGTAKIHLSDNHDLCVRVLGKVAVGAKIGIGACQQESQLMDWNQSSWRFQNSVIRLSFLGDYCIGSNGNGQKLQLITCGEKG